MCDLRFPGDQRVGELLPVDGMQERPAERRVADDRGARGEELREEARRPTAPAERYCPFLPLRPELHPLFKGEGAGSQRQVHRTREDGAHEGTRVSTSSLTSTPSILGRPST